jgi:hypothetical protein
MNPSAGAIPIACGEVSERLLILILRFLLYENVFIKTDKAYC